MKLVLYGGYFVCGTKASGLCDFIFTAYNAASPCTATWMTRRLFHLQGAPPDSSLQFSVQLFLCLQAVSRREATGSILSRCALVSDSVFFTACFWSLSSRSGHPGCSSNIADRDLDDGRCLVASAPGRSLVARFCLCVFLVSTKTAFAAPLVAIHVGTVC